MMLKGITTIVIMALAVAVCNAGNSTGENDVFVNLGRLDYATVPGFEKNNPPQLADIDLPWQGAEKRFTPVNKIDTRAEFEAALEKMRQQYAPFMADLAPAIPKTRQCRPFTTFQWRLATDADRQDIAVPLNGDGQWEQVTLPHYGGPVNKAMSFYRTQFTLSDQDLQQDRLMLHFNGVDYIADIYLNGVHLGSHEGLFDAFEFDLKPHAKAGTNTLLVQLQNDATMMGDNFQIHWKDGGRKYGKKFAACGGPGWDNPDMGWVMCPPGFGIWQKAHLELRPAVSISDIFVQPRPQDAEAEVWVEMEGTIDDDVKLTYSLYGQNFKATLAENEKVTPESAMVAGKTCLRFTVPFPKDTLRWWSHETPWLYQLQVFAYRNGKLIDAQKRQVGMRTFVQSTSSTPKGRFYLNGKEIKLRGANMMGNLMQCVIRNDMDQLRDDILIAKLANMTFWRMTQQPCQEEVYDYFDKLGMLAQTDMPTFVGIWRSQHDEAIREVETMVRLVRSHPCNALISYINEPTFGQGGGRKPMMGRKETEDLFREFDQRIRILNPQQVRKWVDGDYPNLSPDYSDHHDYAGWYGKPGGGLRNIHTGHWHSTRAGWMHGCGEFGAEGLDSVATMEKLYPEKWKKQGPDGSWDPGQIFRCQTATVGKAWLDFSKLKTMSQWVAASQDHQKWVARLQTEAYRRDAKMNSFAIHLLIDAWPAGWLKSLVSNDRTPKPAYYDYRDALTPLAANLRTDRYYIYSGETVPVEAWICNDTPTVPDGATIAYQLELGDKVIQSGSADAKIVASEPTFQGFIKVTAPEVENRQPLALRYAVVDEQGNVLHDTVVVLDLMPKAEQGNVQNLGGRPQRILGR